MNEHDFHDAVDDLMDTIEEAIDSSGADIDCENSGGLLTLTCEENGSQIVLSRQPAAQEVWLAARSGGFHFRLEEGGWRNTIDAEPLSAALVRVCLDQSGVRIDFAF